MSDRPDRKRRPAARPVAIPADGGAPGWVVVPYRTGRQSAKLLPPILLLMLGTAFLGYRTRVSDWRGISSLFEPRPRPVAIAPISPPPPVTPTIEAPAPAAVAVAASRPEPTPTPTPPAEKAKPEPGPVVGKVADPLDDIRRESEATRERIASLEKLKAEEARKLEKLPVGPSKDGRAPRKPGKGVVPRGPIEVDRIVRAQEREIRRQIAEFQLRENKLIAAMEREFFNDRGPARAAPPASARLPLRDFTVEPGRVLRPPEGAVARFRVSRGPNGLRFEARPIGPAPSDVPPPPPRPWRGP